MIEDFNNISTQGLKHLGHRLLEEYISIDRSRNQKQARDKAYEKLNSKLNRMYGRHHFGKMDTRAEVIQAVFALRKMIKKRKEKNAWKGASVILPREQMLEAIRKLST